MKAIVFKKSGPPEVLSLQEIEKPTPKKDEILVKIHAGTVTVADVKLRKIPKFLQKLVFPLFGFGAKDIWGVEVAGVVEDAGKAVTLFKKGDRVFGTTTGQSTGGNAEYICLPERSKNQVVAVIPATLSFNEAAALPVGGMTVLQLLGKARLGKGQKVLVYGASGSVGTYAVQIIKQFGAEVTGVCSTANLELVKSLGAERVIDYTREDFTRGGETYDVIFDAVGKLSRGKCKKSIKENGVFISVKSPTKETIEDIKFLIELVQAGRIRPIIDRIYPLDQVVEAHRYVEAGHKKGNVIISVDPT